MTEFKMGVRDGTENNYFHAGSNRSTKSSSKMRSRTQSILHAILQFLRTIYLSTMYLVCSSCFSVPSAVTVTTSLVDMGLLGLFFDVKKFPGTTCVKNASNFASKCSPMEDNDGEPESFFF